MRRLGGIAFFVVLMLAGPATAGPLQGEQWLTHRHTICQYCGVSNGNVVGFWQTVLWSDGFLPACGSSGIDGYFGGGTAAATYHWQGAVGIGQDGVVGPATWWEARRWVFYTGSRELWWYAAWYSPFNLIFADRTGIGQWFWAPPAGGGAYAVTDHIGPYFSRC